MKNTWFLHILCLGLILFSGSLQAQCPSNIGFELNVGNPNYQTVPNFTQWTGYTGSCCPVNTPNVGIVNNRHTITGPLDGGDGEVPLIPQVCPFPGFGQHSVRLGNRLIGAQAERLTTRMFVTSSNTALIYAFAAIIENPANHTINEMARFEVNIKDTLGNSLPCGFYQFIAGQNIPFQSGVGAITNRVLQYRNWSTFAIDLSPYIGQNIDVEFSTGDCSLTGHYGYAYFDNRCDIFQIATRYCPGDLTVEMVAPSGFQNYLWQPSGITTQTLIVTNPTVDTVHTVTLTPFNGTNCNITIRDTIRRMDVTSSFTPVTCFGGSDGTATGISINGTPFFSYSWSTNPPQSTQTATGLAAGSYVVSVTDATGCTLLDTIIIPSPPPGMTITKSFTNTSCFGASDGTASVSVTGGNPGYQYSWNTLPPQNTANATALPRGTYTVTVTDQLGCELRDSIIINQPPQLTANITATAISCFGASTGTAVVTPTGGTPLYSYSWNTNPIQTTQQATGLSLGTYTVSITDVNNCFISRNVSNTQPTQITSTDSHTPVLCFGGNSGTATVLPSGGVPNYTITWPTNPPQSGQTATGLASGNYVVTVTDANNCNHFDTVFVGTLPAMTGTTTTTPVFCLGGNNGTAEVTAGGGTPPYTYSWSTTPTQSATIASGLSIGNYVVTITDANNCQLQRTASVTQLPTLAVTTSSTPVTCNGGNNGIVMASGGGGTPGYTYSWNTTPVQNTDTATVLYAGSYTVTITDTNGCTTTAQAIVSQPPPLTGTTTSTPVYCFGGTNGTATVNVFGGTPGYTYAWTTTPIQITTTASGLTNGNYGVTVTDTNGCVLTLPVTVATLPPLVSNTFFTEVSCGGGSDGTASVSVTGGSPGYSYSWQTSPVQNAQVATGLFAGTYDVVITDIYNCRDTASVIVTEPTPLVATATATSVLCFGQSTGVLDGGATGGMPGYQFAWSTVPVRTTVQVSGVPAGTYTLTARDSRGCLASTTVTMLQPDLLQATTTFTQPLCFGGNDGSVIANPRGGVTPYTYVWSNGQTTQTAINVNMGTYFVTIEDANGCRITVSENVTEPVDITLSMSGVDLTCTVPPDNGIGSVMATGGTAPYTYLWDGGTQVTQAYNTGFPAGTWTVRVEDANGCQKFGEVVLRNPELPVAHTLNDTFMCENSGGVPIGGWGTGGIPPYTFEWIPNNGSLSGVNFQNPLANPDTSTTYYLQVTDAAGCRSMLEPQRVTVYPLPIVDAGPDLNYCKDGPAIFLQAEVLNPMGMYDVQWQPANGVFCDTCLMTYATPDTTTIFTVWVRSRTTGCRSENTTLNSISSAVIHVKPRPIADAGPDTTICLGSSATLCGVGTGAGPNYTYKWSPTQFLVNDAVQCAVSNTQHTMKYYLVVSSDGCDSPADSVMVNVNTLPVTDAGNVKNICEGDSVQLNGSVQLGMAQAYEWIPRSGLSQDEVLTPNASPSNSGWYYLRAYNGLCAGAWDSVQVIVHSVPRAEAGLDTTICAGQPVPLQGNYTGGTQPVHVQWTPSSGLPVQNILNPVATPQVTTLYYLETRSGTGTTICRTVDSVLVTVLPGVQAMLEADTTVLCAGASVHLTAQGGVGNATYTWWPSTGINGSGAQVLASPVETTEYRVIVSEGRCSDTASVMLSVHPAPKAGFTMSQPEGCNEVVVKFNDLSSNSLTHIWDFGDGSAYNNQVNPGHVYTESGNYTVRLIVQGIGGCRDTLESSLLITLREGIVADIFSDPVAPVELVIPMTEIRLEERNSRATDWKWSFGDGGHAEGKAVRHTYKLPGTYYVDVEVTDASGCRDLRRIGPYIVKEEVMDIPNVFSPNGDGVNDIFRVAYDGDELFMLEIFDRWGVKYHESRNKEQGWDGLDLNGKDASVGVYFYTVKAGAREYQGSITLLR